LVILLCLIHPFDLKNLFMGHKHVTLFVLLLVSVLSVLAQEKGEISVGVGPSFPVGQFAGVTTWNANDGYAKAGHIADIGYAYPLGHSGFSLTAQLWGRLNDINTPALANTEAQTFQGYHWSDPEKPWKTAALMGGGNYSLDLPWTLVRGLRAEGGLVLGAALAQFANFTQTGTRTSPQDPSTTDEVLITSYKVSSIAFSGLAHLGLSYPFGKHLRVHADVDFWGTKPTFKNATQSILTASGIDNSGYLYSATSMSTMSTTSNATQSMNSVDLTAGVSWHL
jgi:hypothetical protein